jgi:hypothetical protein
MFFAKFLNNIIKFFLELFVFDKKKRSIIKSRWAKKYLKNYVDSAVKNVVQVQSTCDDKIHSPGNSNIIWQYWHQGVGNATPLIQKCLESTQKYHSDKKIIVLDLQKIKNYVDIPSGYYDLLNSGKMKVAHFSDILRTYLLAHYGGTWVDATIYFTGRIPEDILNSEFFVFSKNRQTDLLENNMSNYFIHSKPENIVIEAIKYALNEYWKENDFVINYFMYEHIATMLSDAEIIKEVWERMPAYKTEKTGLLYRMLYEDYSQEKWNEITAQSTIHKLSYKILRDSSSGKSYYDKIINQ